MFSFFKKKTAPPDTGELNMDRLWAMYESGDLDLKNHEMFVLCAYESGVNGEGHDGFFFNNRDHSEDYCDVLRGILPDDFSKYFMSAYQAFCSGDGDEACDAADDHFFKNEQDILDILQDYADRL